MTGHLSVSRRKLVVPAAGAALFGWLFYVRFWKWRDCIEEAASSCVTPDGDNLIGAGALWAVPAACCLAVLVWRLLRPGR